MRAWEVEEDEACTAFVRSYDGSGALQISAYQADVPQWATDNLREYLDEQGTAAEIETTIVDGQEFACSSYERDGWLTTLWFICKSNYLLFVTYHGDPAAENLELDDVEAIIQSVRIIESPPLEQKN